MKFFFLIAVIGLTLVKPADAQDIPIPRNSVGTFDRVVWQAPDGFVREIGHTGKLYFEPFEGGGATARSGVNAVTVAGDLNVHTARNITAQSLARAGRLLARTVGPLGLIATGIELANFIYDESSGDWLIEEGADDYLGRPGSYSLPRSFPSDRCMSYFENCSLQETMDIVLDHLDSSGFDLLSTDFEYLGSNSDPNGLYTVIYKDPARLGNLTYSISYHESNTCLPGHSLIDGVCISDSRSATDAELEDAIYIELVSREMGSDLARRLIQAGYIPDMEPLQVFGPSSIAGETETSTITGPSGTTTVNRTTNYDIAYNGDTVTVTGTETTTRTDPAGNVSTETKTRTPASNPGSGRVTRPQTPPEQTITCDEFAPNSSACAELGDPSDDTELEKEEREINWESTLSAAGACPAPLTFSAQGQSFELSYEPACTFAEFVNPFVVGMSWLLAGIWLFGVFKQ